MFVHFGWFMVNSGGDKSYLTLVDPRSAHSHEHDSEFIPLPFYPFDERPASMLLELEECETAIHLAEGHIPKAAALLKVPQFKLDRMLRRHPRLQRIYEESCRLVGHRGAGEMIDALDSPNDRRREWAATKILASKACRDHPFSPAPAEPSQASIALTQTPNSRTITFRFRNDSDPDPANE